MRQLFFLASALLLLFLLVRCDKATPPGSFSLKWSARVDSVLKDTLFKDPIADSLKKVLRKPVNDTMAIDALNALAFAWRGEPTKILTEEAIRQSRQLNYFNGEAAALCYKGVYYLRRGQFDTGEVYIGRCQQLAKEKKLGYRDLESQFWFLEIQRVHGAYEGLDNKYLKLIGEVKKYKTKNLLGSIYISLGETYVKQYKSDKSILATESAIGIFSQLGSHRDLATCYNQLGSAYTHQNNNNLALLNYQKALKYIEELNDKKQAAVCFGSLGQVYYTQHNFTKAIEYYKKACAISEELGIAAYVVYNNLMLGQTLTASGRLNESKEIYKNMLELSKKIGDRIKQMECYSLMAEIDIHNKNYAGARQCYVQAMELAKQSNDKGQIYFCEVAMSGINYGTNNYKEAEQWGLKALDDARELGSPLSVKDAADILWRIYEAKNEPGKAFPMHKLYVEMKDSISNTDQVRRFAAIEYQSKEDKLKADQEKKEIEYKAEQVRKEAELSRQKTVRNAFIGGFAVVLVLAFIIFRSLRANQEKNRIITRQKALVEEKQREILDSIHYAKKIQTSLMTSEKYIEKELKKFLG